MQGQKHIPEQCAGKLSSQFLRMGTLLQVCYKVSRSMPLSFQALVCRIACMVIDQKHTEQTFLLRKKALSC